MLTNTQTYRLKQTNKNKLIRSPRHWVSVEHHQILHTEGAISCTPKLCWIWFWS